MLPNIPVAISQYQAEFDQLLLLYAALQPKRVLEIGTYAGGSLYHWLKLATPGTTVVNVDPYESGTRGGEFFDSYDNRHLYESWTPPWVKCVTIKGYSTEPYVIKQVADYGQYDWIFVDGDHTLDGVRKDWANYSPMMKAGCFVFHDIVRDETCGLSVPTLWKELRKVGHITQEFVTDLPDGWVKAGIGVVYLPAAQPVAR